MHPDIDPIRLSVIGATALWTGLAEARGHEVIRGGSFLAFDSHGRPGGVRCLVDRPPLSADDVDHLKKLVTAREDLPAAAEDPYGTLDLTGTGLTPVRLPIMTRYPAPFPSLTSDVRVVRADEPLLLATVEEVIIAGFPVPAFQPYEPGQMFPPAVLDRPGFDFFLALRDDVPAGACMTVATPTVGGVYWVATLPDHRSRGVGRALMHVALERLDGPPVTLVATAKGEPLYRKLGFESDSRSLWWQR